MEKLTIDIDKVLDDFEEIEALNLEKNKNVSEYLPCPGLEDGCDSVSELSVNKEKEIEKLGVEDVNIDGNGGTRFFDGNKIKLDCVLNESICKPVISSEVNLGSKQSDKSDHSNFASNPNVYIDSLSSLRHLNLHLYENTATVSNKQERKTNICKNNNVSYSCESDVFKNIPSEATDKGSSVLTAKNHVSVKQASNVFCKNYLGSTVQDSTAVRSECKEQVEELDVTSPEKIEDNYSTQIQKNSFLVNKSNFSSYENDISKSVCIANLELADQKPTKVQSTSDDAKEVNIEPASNTHTISNCSSTNFKHENDVCVISPQAFSNDATSVPAASTLVFSNNDNHSDSIKLHNKISSGEQISGNQIGDFKNKQPEPCDQVQCSEVASVKYMQEILLVAPNDESDISVEKSSCDDSDHVYLNNGEIDKMESVLNEQSNNDAVVQDDCVIREDNDSGVSSEEDAFLCGDEALVENGVASDFQSETALNSLENVESKSNDSETVSVFLPHNVENINSSEQSQKSVDCKDCDSPSESFSSNSAFYLSSVNTGARPKEETQESISVENCCNLVSKCLESGLMDPESNDSEPPSKNSDDISIKNFVPQTGVFPGDSIDSPSDKHSNFIVDSHDDEKASVNNDESEFLSPSAENLNNDADTSKFCLMPHQQLPRPKTLDLPFRNQDVSQPVPASDPVVPSNHSTLVSESLAPEGPSQSIVNEMSVSNQQPQIGLTKPFWIPDSDAPYCMHCGTKFTVIKRRHHCRACGRVLCSRCCNLRAKLAYLTKETRVCLQCFKILSSCQNELPQSETQASSSPMDSSSSSPSPLTPQSGADGSSSWRPHPNNPDEYCSTIPPLQQVDSSEARPPPTVLVPIGVLKRGSKSRKEPKQVIFSDGIRPGGDLLDIVEPTDVSVHHRTGRKRIERTYTGILNNSSSSSASIVSKVNRQKRALVSDDEGSLPPIVLDPDLELSKKEKITWNDVLELMQDSNEKPVCFSLLKNISIFAKLIKLDCCFGKECWCISSHGFHAFCQDEVMVVLERLPGENAFPRGILNLYTYIFDCAIRGTTFEDLGHLIFPEQILGSSDHRGFLFVRPTFQCLSKLALPNAPFLVAVLIHKWEVPWAKIFPLRLMLRLGAECRYYPCSLVSIRHRKPVFFEIGQTIMSVLADLRNFQFTLPVIPGLVVHMEEKKTCVNIPQNYYNKVIKVLSCNNVDHVLALGSNFSSEADSHLVCVQKEEGDYQTQAINIENTTRKVTGASFIVFSGALKTSSGLSAKFSIVEDGILVQILPDAMVALHLALRDMKDFTIHCGPVDASEPEELVLIQWVKDDKNFNIGVSSPVDGKSFEGIPNLRIHNSTDYASHNFLIRWTEVFFIQSPDSENSSPDGSCDPCHLAENIAQSCCTALVSYLDQLVELDMNKIGLRMSFDLEHDKVGYDIGACCKPLPAVCMNSLDCNLIPIISRLSCSAHTEPLSFELIFHILSK